MREHAIPQDITGYHFHIIGNMTIKQFAEIGAGVLFGVGIYATNLPILVKWPLIAIVVGIGAMAAFVPIEERPFDHWIVIFFRVLYKPTKFFWRRTPKVPDAFLFKPDTEAAPSYAEIDLKPARRQRIKDYLTSMERPLELNQLDLSELARLQSLSATFQADQTIPGTSIKKVEKPDLKVRVRSYKAPTEPNLSQPEVIFDATQAQTQVILQTNYQNTTPHAHLAINQVAQKIVIPELPEISVETSAATQEEAGFQNDVLEPETRAYLEPSPTLAPTSELPSQTATLNTNLPFPLPPTEPNKLVGMVLNPNNDLLNDTIIEIQTEAGQVARAVKTNALGQFFVTTPLANGTYTIQAEKDGYQFSPLQLLLSGEVIPPLEIRSA